MVKQSNMESQTDPHANCGALERGQLDRLGAFASFLCAVHCLAAPFLFFWAPITAGSFLFNHQIERVFVALAAIFGVIVILTSIKLHHDRRPIYLLLGGIGLATLGAYSEIHENLIWHAVFLVSGGTLIAIAHLFNRRRVRSAHHHN